VNLYICNMIDGYGMVNEWVGLDQDRVHVGSSGVSGRNVAFAGVGIEVLSVAFLFKQQ